MRHKYVSPIANTPSQKVSSDRWNQDHVMPALSADPADPDPGEAVMWMSDGTGYGDNGDIIIKVNVGGTVKTATLLDFSILS